MGESMSGNRARRKGQAGELAAQKELQRFGAVYTRYYTAQQASADGIPDFVVRDPFSTCLLYTSPSPRDRG